MASVNKVILVGNLGKDPEIRTMQNGGRVANFTLATSETWKDRNTGERREKTEWHRVSVWNDGLVGVIERFLKKGSKVYLEGQLETRKWTDQGGQERYTTEVVLKQFRGELVMLDGRGEGGGGGGESYGGGERSGGYSGGGERSGGSGAGAGGGYERSGGYGGARESGPGPGPGSGPGRGGSPNDLDDEIPF